MASKSRNIRTDKDSSAVAILMANSRRSCRLCDMIERGIPLHKMQEVNHLRCMKKQALEWIEGWKHGQTKDKNTS